MKVLKQSIPFFLDSVKEHAAMKNAILAAIGSVGTHSLIEPNFDQKLSNTDYHLHMNYRRAYMHLIQPMVMEHLAKVTDFIKPPANGSLISNSVWFQQYEKGDYHGWHGHEESQFSSVYYLDLPEGSSFTSFKYLGEEYEVSVSEGDILTFPSCIFHCSKPNKSDKVKTVIAFNSVITGYKV